MESPIYGDIPDFQETGTGLNAAEPCRDSIIPLPQSKTGFRKANEVFLSRPRSVFDSLARRSNARRKSKRFQPCPYFLEIRNVPISGRRDADHRVRHHYCCGQADRRARPQDRHDAGRRVHRHRQGGASDAGRLPDPIPCTPAA